MQSTKVTEEEKKLYKLLNLWYSNTIDDSLQNLPAECTEGQ